MNLNLHDIVTPAGIVALGLIIRQLIEVLKGVAPLSWLDAGNERKATIGIALLAYIAWYAAYATNPATDVFTALGSWIAVSLAAMGANEAIDAGQQTLARTIAKQMPVALAPAAVPPAQAPGDQDAEEPILPGGPAATLPPDIDGPDGPDLGDAPTWDPADNPDQQTGGGQA